MRMGPLFYSPRQYIVPHHQTSGECDRLPAFRDMRSLRSRGVGKKRKEPKARNCACSDVMNNPASIRLAVRTGGFGSLRICRGKWAFRRNATEQRAQADARVQQICRDRLGWLGVVLCAINSVAPAYHQGLPSASHLASRPVNRFRIAST